MPLYTDDTQRLLVAKRCRLVFIVLTLLGVYELWGEMHRLDHNADIAASPAVTTGAVSYVHWGKGGDWFYYSYNANGAYHEGKANGYTPFPAEPAVGEKLKVTYSAVHPQWSVAGDVPQQTGSHVGAFALMLLLFAAIGGFAHRAVVRLSSA